MAESSYEVFTNDGQRWTMERSFSATEEKDAINLAEELFQLKKIVGVRVLLETIDPMTGEPRDKTILKKKKKKNAPDKAAPDKATVGAGVTGGEAEFVMSGAVAASSSRLSDNGAGVTSGEGGGFAISSNPEPIVMTMLLSKAAAGAVAAGIIGILVNVLLSALFASRGYGSTITSVSIFTFIASYAGVIYLLLNSAEMAQVTAFINALKPGSTPDLGPIHVQPSPAVSSGFELAPSPEPVASDGLANAASSDLATSTFMIEAHRVSVLKDDTKSLITFLNDALTGLQEFGRYLVDGRLDSYDKFGCHLFLAGAVESLARAGGRTRNECRWLIAKMLESVDLNSTVAIHFAENHEEYLMVPRYAEMYRAGRDAMERYANGNRAVRLGAALDTWNEKSTQRPTTDYVAVMFTDIVGSTELTQIRGDVVSYELLQAHNAIVRDAIKVNSGREVKHTGDGIMAAFGQAVHGVMAAMQIQRAAHAHNIQRPDLPLKLRIGLNAGEPIKEGTDLFGSTVQLAARVCAQADTGQIVVSYVVQGLCAAKNLPFVYLGTRELKGFKDPIEIYHVPWS